jgi:hypothetical protein
LAILERLLRRWGPRRGPDLLDGAAARAADGGHDDDDHDHGDVQHVDDDEDGDEGLIVAAPEADVDEEDSEDGASSTSSTRWWLWWLWGLVEHVVRSSSPSSMLINRRREAASVSTFVGPDGKKVRTFQAYLPGCHRTYSCVHCRAHLANHDELISKVIAGPVYHCTVDPR